MNPIGLDLGGTKILAVRVGPGGEILDELRRDTPADGDAIVHCLATMASELAAGDELGPLGVGAAGMVDRDGVVRYAPNVPAFRWFPLRERLAEHTGGSVVVHNDANAAAWGEYRYGAAAGTSDALAITLGTGIGGGIVVNGHLVTGAEGFAAELGHFQVVADGPVCACGEIGHWEATASGRSFGELARANGVDTGEELAQRALAGDATALAVVGEYAERVAVGLAGLVNILDPEVVVIGGGLVGLGETLLAPLREALAVRIEGASVRRDLSVVAAALGVYAGAIGAAALALEEATA
ncbi:MAG: ROK family protein [Actinobacteria bacterium]|nr:ROK family protein [Actinomycetota bacterium]